MNTEQFDMVVFGGGKAGKSLAMDQAKTGKRVAVIERQYLGGSCINVACIPSKTLIASSRRFRPADDASAAMARTGRVVGEMVDYNRRLFDASGLHLIWGEGRFIGPKTLSVVTASGTRVVTANQVYINLGTVASLPDYPGLAEAKPATHVEALAWTVPPSRLVVLGGGYVAVELAQAFRRLGSEVTILVRGERLLGREDADLVAVLHETLTEQGVALRYGAQVDRVEGRSGDRVSVTLRDGSRVEGSHLLVATGRRQVTDGIGLELAGVAVDDHGLIRVNERLETTAAGVSALGECAGTPQFTHASFDDFRVAKSVLNAGPRTTRDRLIPSCVFTEPEIARVGLSETEAQAAGIAYRLAKLPVEVIPRAWTLGERKGLLKALIAPDDKILGFAMIGPSAGEVMSIVHIAMLGGLPYTTLRDAILAHPTMAEALNLLFAAVKPA
jgi:pyruvate/2-oxoglutarate dehydrogenase complex dihydrolipoamide dehydrogenase (E3) component